MGTLRGTKILLADQSAVLILIAREGGELAEVWAIEADGSI